MNEYNSNAQLFAFISCYRGNVYYFIYPKLSDLLMLQLSSF